MEFIQSFRGTIYFSKTWIILGLILMHVPSTAFGIGANVCLDADVVPLNESLRGYGDTRSESYFFRLEVPAAGLITVDVTVPGISPREAKLGFFGPGCDGSGPTGGEWESIEKTPTRLILRSETPGTYMVAVASQDPQRILGHYRLIAGYVPDEWPVPVTPGQPLNSIDDDNAGEDPGELEDEPNVDETVPQPPQPPDPSDPPQTAPEDLCEQFDDHGDTFACATRLRGRRGARGLIENDWGDDHDLFRFKLTETMTVHLKTTGVTDTFGVLYDREGHRLATNDDGGVGDNFRIVRTLAPGIYFIRVEGTVGAEGSYTLHVETRPW